MEQYDVVIIGSGVGGTAAAYALRAGGKTVALIENDAWGGTCPNHGCDPKKVLAAGLEALERNNQLAGKGLAPIHSIQWPQLMAFKRSFTAPYPAQFKKEAEAQGIKTITGSARFASGREIAVGDTTLKAGAAIIATGQRPAIIPIPGKQHLKTSTDFLDMDELPESIIFIGAGYISFELAAIAGAAGSSVSIVDSAPRPLRGFDDALVDEMVKAYESRGVRFAFGVNIKQLGEENGRYRLSGEGYSETADCVICAAGRMPNTDGLGLENAGVEYTKQGIVVNQYLQTANENIFACGDVLAKKQPRLTPVSSFEGQYLAQRILGGQAAAISYPAIASVVFGSPKLATVGVSPTQAAEEPGRYKVKETDMTGWFSYRHLNEPVAKAKLVFEGKHLVGASVLSGQADVLINLLTILIEQKITHEGLGRLVFAWPTIASDLSSLV